MEIGVGMAVSSISSADPAHPRNVEVMTIPPMPSRDKFGPVTMKSENRPPGAQPTTQQCGSEPTASSMEIFLASASSGASIIYLLQAWQVLVELKISVFATALGF